MVVSVLGQPLWFGVAARYSDAAMSQPDNTPLGEDALIAEFLVPLAAQAPGARGLLDDCASLTPPAGMDLVLKTDPIRAGVHFFADDDPADIAWKALAVNVSDLAAKGAKPLVYLLALSFPEPPTRAWMRAFAEGLRTAQAAFGCHLTGGDTDRAAGPLCVAVTAIGTVSQGRMVPRTGARPGDGIYVSGTIGETCLGLALRRGDAEVAAWCLSTSERASLLGRYLRPQPRLPLSDALLQFASAAMDVSDGLAKDADRLFRASGVGGDVDLRCVPLSDSARRLILADAGLLFRLVTAGDDYEVLCTVAPANQEDFVREATLAGVQVTRIGHVTACGAARFIGQDGGALTLDRLGWTHF